MSAMEVPQQAWCQEVCACMQMRPTARRRTARGRAERSGTSSLQPELIQQLAAVSLKQRCQRPPAQHTRRVGCYHLALHPIAVEHIVCMVKARDAVLCVSMDRSLECLASMSQNHEVPECQGAAATGECKAHIYIMS